MQSFEGLKNCIQSFKPSKDYFEELCANNPLIIRGITHNPSNLRMISLKAYMCDPLTLRRIKYNPSKGWRIIHNPSNEVDNAIKVTVYCLVHSHEKWFLKNAKIEPKKVARESGASRRVTLWSLKLWFSVTLGLV